MRRTECASLASEYIDTEKKIICLPSSLTKNKREHSFPLGDFTLRLLSSPLSQRSSVPPYPSQKSSSPTLLFLARGASNTPFNGWSKSKAALDKLCGVTEWTLHDTRRTYATNLAKLGVQLPVIERLLNHVSGSFAGVVGIYQRHHFMDEMRDAVERYEVWFSRLIA